MTATPAAPPRECAPSVPVGQRPHRISDGDGRAILLAEQCRREVAHRLRVDVDDVALLPDAPLPKMRGWVLIRAQWLPPWRQP